MSARRMLAMPGPQAAHRTDAGSAGAAPRPVDCSFPQQMKVDAVTAQFGEVNRSKPWSTDKIVHTDVELTFKSRVGERLATA